MRGFIMLIYCLYGSILMAQDFTVSGKVMDSKDMPLSFVNVLIFKAESETPFKGATTEADGSFIIKGLEAGTYSLSFSYVGFEDHSEVIDLSANKNIEKVFLKENQEMLDETVVTAKRPTIEKTSGKLVFNVENTSLSVGSTMDLLKKTPGIVVIGESIQIKFSKPTIYINGKRVYLSNTEATSLLENTDASNIKSIEVITNPSAEYDADAGTVLNIVSSKAISIGYKGSVDATYTQGIYPKYSFGTSHFYKNNWLNLYASYNYNTKKQYKEDENFIRFFQPDEVSTKSIWETDFNRTTNSDNHSGNVVLDFTLDDNNSIGLTSNISLSPNTNYQNNGNASIYNTQRQLDSLNTTASEVNYKKDNMAFALDYNRKLNDNGAKLSAVVNYIYYKHNQDQSVNTDYFLPDNDFLRNNSFFTNSAQKSNIFTGQIDFSTSLWGGTFDAGLKFSNIDTESSLGFFDIENNVNTFNNTLSDDFNYKENIFAEYINYKKDWEKWSITAGLRGEYTNIDAISRSLGDVNNQSYFEIFPSASVNYVLNEKNSVGLAYNRNIHRPRYESLNPFKYFITENNFIGGNPNLKPAIEDKITLSYVHKDKLFFDLYYQNVKNALDNLSFQNNENSTLRTMEDNLDEVYQYSFDITYFNSLASWWYFHLTTSSFYLSNKFYALESSQETYTNDTFGQYLGVYSHFTLSKDRSFTADLSALYISNFVFGNRYFKNQSFVNISFRKVFWDKRASLTVGLDDIFNTLNNVASVTKYYNQDNRFFANQESRLFRLGFKYNFGNARLHDNNKRIKTDEGDRLTEK
ncbi:MAG: TonB-dependent receptor domain-containing protein [Aequorivita sp.]